MRSGGVLVLLLALLACASPSGHAEDSMNEAPGRRSQLAPCPDSPNCVSSDAPDAAHRVEPFALAASSAEAWAAARQAVKALPRTEIVESNGHYLRAECRSFLFRFVDDLELHLRPEDGVLAVRSASRVGYSDLGVNRSRVESLRETLRAQGVVE